MSRHSDIAETFNALRDEHRERRAALGVLCPNCRIKPRQKERLMYETVLIGLGSLSILIMTMSFASHRSMRSMVEKELASERSLVAALQNQISAYERLIAALKRQSSAQEGLISELQRRPHSQSINIIESGTLPPAEAKD